MQLPQNIYLKIGGEEEKRKLLCAAQLTINTFVRMKIANKSICLNLSFSRYNTNAHLTKETAWFRVWLGMNLEGPNQFPLYEHC